MESPNHILIVDDDPEIRTLLSQFLETHGFPLVSTAADGQEMRAVLEREEISLLILDIMLPNEDGFTITRSLRGQSPLPIIIISARTETGDRIDGIEMGADDYLTKPFDNEELLARIHAVLRRTNNSVMDDGDHIHFSGLTLSMVERAILRKGHGKVALSGSEFNLLTFFLRHPNKPFTRQQIIREVMGGIDFVTERTIDVKISRLRERLGDRQGNIIKTLRNEGYILASAVTPPPR